MDVDVGYANTNDVYQEESYDHAYGPQESYGDRTAFPQQQDGNGRSSGDSERYDYYDNSMYEQSSLQNEEEEGGFDSDEEGRNGCDSLMALKQSNLAAKRKSPEVTEWLMDNYEAVEGVSMPRSDLYDHYIEFCRESQIMQINAASFGKLIRAVFPNLKTRRLGTRGNSKYHYYGIKLKQVVADLRSVEGTNISKPVKRRELRDPMDDAALPRRQSVSLTFSRDIEFSRVKVKTEPQSVRAFSMEYKDHCRQILGYICDNLYEGIETMLQDFWKKTSCSPSYGRLTVDDEVVNFIIACDSELYTTVIRVLLPNVLDHVPGNLTHNIRYFAKHLEKWLESSLVGIPQELINRKIEVARYLCQALKRHTSLNHLAQASRSVLQNDQQVDQMLMDWSKVDFDNVAQQFIEICKCDMEFLKNARESFKETLQTCTKLEEWADWIHGVMGIKAQGFTLEKGKDFLLKWSFFNSLILRDLTLRSASSFGSFHLIRLLFDEYVFYLIENHRKNFMLLRFVSQEAPHEEEQYHQGASPFAPESTDLHNEIESAAEARVTGAEMGKSGKAHGKAASPLHGFDPSFRMS